MKKSRFGLMILAAALCVGTVAASAAGYFRMKDDLARHLEAGEEEASLVSQAGLDLGQSCTVDGWTLTASQAMGDKTQVRVLLELAAPEGTVLEDGHYRLELPMLEPSVTFTIDQVKDEDPADNKLSFVLASIKAKDYRGEKVTFSTKGLSRYKKYTVEELNAGANPLDIDKIVVGDFSLTFDLDYQDTSVVYKPGVEVETPGGKIRVDEVDLSPMSVYVKLSGEGTIPKPDSPAHHGGSGFENTVFDTEFGYTVELRDKDGNGILWTTGDSRPDSITMTFGEIIDPADVAALVLYGVEIPLG